MCSIYVHIVSITLLVVAHHRQEITFSLTSLVTFKFPDFSPTTFKFQDISTFSGWWPPCGLSQGTFSARSYNPTASSFASDLIWIKRTDQQYCCNVPATLQCTSSDPSWQLSCWSHRSETGRQVPRSRHLNSVSLWHFNKSNQQHQPVVTCRNPTHHFMLAKYRPIGVQSYKKNNITSMNRYF